MKSDGAESDRRTERCSECGAPIREGATAGMCLRCRREAIKRVMGSTPREGGQ